MKVFAYTMAGVAVSFGIFATIRSFAKGTPSTMTKEYQEASNEYMKVRLHHTLLLHQSSRTQSRAATRKQMLTRYSGTKHRATLRYLLRGLLRPRNGPVPTSFRAQEVNFSPYREFFTHPPGLSVVAPDNRSLPRPVQPNHLSFVIQGEFEVGGREMDDFPVQSGEGLLVGCAVDIAE